VSLIICDEPRYKNVDAPLPPCKLKNILFFPMFFAKAITVGILHVSP
jgi:hypothetical protein